MAVAQTLEKSQLLDFYHQMVLIRTFEDRAAEQYMRGRIRGFLHLYSGEEAIAVGAISYLEPQDYVVTHYRDHSYALARGVSPKAARAELFGKETGCSKGKGVSMHLFDASLNFMGGYAIVGGQLPIATGLALANSYTRADSVVLCFLGDGALNEGEFHESMNLAAVWKLPVVFLCENNLYGMGTPVEEVLATREIFRAAEPYGIASQRIDGMEVLAVREAMIPILDRVRAGEGPSFVEALTYRFRGHSMADPVEYRTRSEEQRWSHKDSILTHKGWLLEQGLATEEELAALERQAEREVQEAVAFAEESPTPPPEALYENVYVRP